MSSARVWLGPGPEPPNTLWLSYRFGEEEITIHSSAVLDKDLDALSGKFTGAGYSLPAGHSTSTTNKIWIGKGDGSQPEWAKEPTGTTNRIGGGQGAAANGLSAVRSSVAGNRERTVRSTAAAEAVAELGRWA